MSRLLSWLRLRFGTCEHSGLIVPRRYHLLENGVLVELGTCERCGSEVAR